MAEEIPPGPPFEADQQDDVLGKIDQLLNRHRPKASDIEAVPVLVNAPKHKDIVADDGIPVLTDVVAGSTLPAPPAPMRSRSINRALMLQRMSLALEAEHARLLALTGGNAVQAHMLGQMVAELKRALPAVIEAGIAAKASDPAQPDDDGRL